MSIQRAIEQLTPGAGTTLLLRAIDDLSFEAIAIAMDLIPTATRKRYSRALYSLRARLAALAAHSN
ncbi:MAG: DNA-directed RNA polymerase specialized sigma24 family protein [Chlamydiales bacterium]|jgi:DNA-directed RNA polymerase specialized sigma24 family protein